MKRIIGLLTPVLFLLAQSCQERIIIVTDNIFEFEARFSKEEFKSGEPISIELSSNRESVTVLRANCSQDYSFGKLVPGQQLYFTGNRLTVQSEEVVSVEYTQICKVTLEIQDTEKDGEIHKVEFSCSLLPAEPEEIKKPEKFVFATGDLLQSVDRYTDKGKHHTVRFSIEPLGCTPDFYIRATDDRIMPVATLATLNELTDSDISDRLFAYTYDASSPYSPVIYFRAGGKAGEAVLTIGSVYNPQVKQEMKVIVREDIIIEVNASGIHEGFCKSSGGYSGRAIGYAGYLQGTLSARVRKFECPITIQTGENQSATVLSTTEIDTDRIKNAYGQLRTDVPDVQSGKIKVTFYIDCTPERMTSHFIRGNWKEWGYKSSITPNGTLQIKYDSDEWNAHKPTAPSSVNSSSGKFEETVTISAGSAGGSLLPKLTAEVNYCNDVLAIDANYHKTGDWHPTEWKKFDINHKNIEYDRQRYNLRYIIYTYKTSGENGYMGGGKGWWFNKFEYNGKSNTPNPISDFCIDLQQQ